MRIVSIIRSVSLKAEILFLFYFVLFHFTWRSLLNIEYMATDKTFKIQKRILVLNHIGFIHRWNQINHVENSVPSILSVKSITKLSSEVRPSIHLNLRTTELTKFGMNMTDTMLFQLLHILIYDFLIIKVFTFSICELYSFTLIMTLSKLFRS